MNGDAAVELADDGTVENAVATLTRPYGDYDVTVDVLRLKRFDKVMRLEFAVTPRSHGATDDLDYDFFSSSTSSTADGVYLLDSTNLKKYPVLVAQETCICSSDLAAFPLDRPTVLFADFPLAPDSVEKLNVVIPQMGVLPVAEIE